MGMEGTLGPGQRKRDGLEILAPAGSFPCVTAAVRCGADAVYLGLSAFNARGNAPGFTPQELEEALAQCREHRVKAYLALNTVTFDREEPALRETIAQAAGLGFDGVIVQDLGVARLLREMCPSLPLHGSTQMSVHSLRGVEELARLGFSRAVLARELSCKEVEAIARRSPLPLEVFVHGALCMSVSGQCYLSAMIGGRSGNRGLCAQPCRLPCRLSLEAGDKPGRGEEYALSLKDLSLIPRLKELEQMGIASAKIEGRMKRAEYVAAAVTACREALSPQGLSQGAWDRLRGVFARSGFTGGYWDGKRDGSMFGARSKEDVTAAAGVLDELARSYHSQPQVFPVDMDLQVAPDQPPSLTVSHGDIQVRVQGDSLPGPARTRGIDREGAEKFLGKTGGTPYYLNRLTLQGGEGLFLPGAALNKLRRQGLEALSARRRAKKEIPLSLPAWRKGPLLAPGYAGALPLRGRFHRLEQVYPGAFEELERVILPLSQILRAGKERRAFPPGKLLAELPRFCPAGEEGLLGQLKEAAALGAVGVVSGNLSGASLAREAGLPLCLDFGMNLTNSLALAWAGEALSASEAVLSFETQAKDIAGLYQVLGERGEEIPLSHPPKIGVLAYGYLPLMLLRSCPVHHEKGCQACLGREGAAIVDRTGARMALQCLGGYSQLLNSVPLYLGNRMDRFPGVGFAQLYFTLEDSQACEEMVRRFRNGEPAPGPATGGLYYRGVK